MHELSANKLATILNYQRLSTEDGPGIRTTVFFKGCPLHCSWCHNPESIHSQKEMQWMATRCIGCNTCIQICPENALKRNPEGLSIDRSKCNICGSCWQACPSNALEILGNFVSVDEMVKEILKDETYYQKSNGGVTFSGGEPTLQSAFLLEALKQLRSLGIQTALDTCGFFTIATLEKLLPFCNLILYDLKLIDSNLHQQTTGQSNELILQNLQHLVSLKSNPAFDFNLWIRTPLIPGITATQKNLSGIASFLLGLGSERISRWELCAFNNLCQDKYKRLDLEWKFNQTPLMSNAELKSCREWSLETGFPPEKVFVTGSAKVENL